MIRTEGFFRAYKNVELFYQSWKTSENPNNVIIVTHGMGEHSESYNIFADGILPDDYIVYAFDLRGHGRSEGKRGVASLGEYVEDLNYFYKMVKAKEANKKTYLLGHSMGGLILMEFLLWQKDLEIAGAIFSSPLFGLTVEVPVVKDMAARALVRFLPNITLYNELKHDDLTHDMDIVEAYDKDPLRHTQICPRLYIDFLEAFSNVRRKVKECKYPILMQIAGTDRIVSSTASQEIFGLLGSEDKQKIIYKEMFHEIYNEVDRDKVYGDLKQWLKEH